MSQIVLIDFGFATPGTAVPDDFVTAEGMRVTLPRPSRMELSGTGVGVRIDTSVILIPAIPFDAVSIRAFAGANAPVVRFIDPSGVLISSVQTVKSPDQTVSIGLSDRGAIGRIDLDYPNGEGTIYAVAGVAATEK